MQVLKLFFLTITAALLILVDAVDGKPKPKTKPTVYKPQNANQLQGALDSSKPGDQILIRPGLSFSNPKPYTFPKKQGTGVITVDGISGVVRKQYAVIPAPLVIEGENWVIKNLKVQHNILPNEVQQLKIRPTPLISITGNKNTLNNVGAISIIGNENQDGIHVKGNDNVLKGITVSGKGENGIFVKGKGNKGGEFTITGPKTGVRIEGDGNVFVRAKMYGVQKTAIGNTDNKNIMSGVFHCKDVNIPGQNPKAKTASRSNSIN